MIAGRLLIWPAKRWPDKVAIVFENERLTFAQINERINRLAHGLISLGLKKQKRVGILMTNSPRFVETRFALQKAGLTFVRLNTREEQQ